MKKRLATIALCILTAASVAAQSFDNHFDDKTLRLDYIFAGNAGRAAVSTSTPSPSEATARCA